MDLRWWYLPRETSVRVTPAQLKKRRPKSTLDLAKIEASTAHAYVDDCTRRDPLRSSSCVGICAGDASTSAAIRNLTAAPAATEATRGTAMRMAAVVVVLRAVPVVQRNRTYPNM